MGCTASKLENEETVRRCKDRCRRMRDAVYARYHLATAHSDYCRSLRLTADALCTFAAGEPLAVAGNTPAVFLNTETTSPPPQRHPPPPSSSSAGAAEPHAVSGHTAAILLKTNSNPPPPRHPPLPSAAVTRRRRNPPPKLPHILSESSLCSSPRSQLSSYSFFPTAQQAPSTASETSSVWNWENFYPPPSPPGSDYFRHRSNPPNPKPETANSETPEGESDSAYNLFHSKSHHRENRKFENANIDSRRQHQLDREGSEYEFFPEHETVRTQGEPEEVLCSEWGDRDSCCTSSSEDEEREIAGSARAEQVAGGDTPAAETAKVTVRHRDLKEIVEAVRENFEKAAVAGDELSDLLEIGRDQIDRSFKQLKKTVYHSSSLLSKLNSRWTSKPPLAVKYRFDTGSLDKPGGPKSLCSTLDRLLAWEKKLYLEVKAREGVKIEHEKKLSALQSQESKGGDEAKLDKTKTSITRLQSLIVVTSQAVSTTSAAIDSLRDSDLVPQLVELCHRIMYMWRSMHQHHETQSSIVKQVRGLVNRSSKNHSTSETHKQATRELESAVSSWHASFNRLIKFQRDFILSLHCWFKLNLIPINNNNMEQPSHQAFRFFDEWKLALDRVPDTVCSEAIKSFINVVHVIHVKQCEELKIRKRTETASKALEKKSSSLRDIERKFYSSYSAVGVVGIPDSVPDDGQVLDARDPLAEKKIELAGCKRRVEDEMVRHSKAVEVTRAMTLNNLQTGLPGVFQALTSFSSLFIEALESVCKHSYAVK